MNKEARTSPALEGAMNQARHCGLIGWGGAALRRMWFRRQRSEALMEPLREFARKWAEHTRKRRSARRAVAQLKAGWRW